MFEEDEKRVEILYKVLLLGDWSVGKTCLLMRYMDNTFTEMHLSTIGIDSKFKRRIRCKNSNMGYSWARTL